MTLPDYGPSEPGDYEPGGQLEDPEPICVLPPNCWPDAPVALVAAILEALLDGGSLSDVDIHAVALIDLLPARIVMRIAGIGRFE